MNKQFYIVDTTLPVNQSFVKFSTIDELIKHLEGTIQRYIGKNRQQWMQDWQQLGNGDDDKMGVTFVSSLSEYFNIGAIHSDGRQIKCNIFESARNNKYRDECGD